MASQTPVSYGPMETIQGPRSTKYRQEVMHHGLHKHRVFTASSPSEVRNKVRTQVDDWNEQWLARLDKEDQRRSRQDAKEEAEMRKAEAAERTAEAKAALEAVDSILAQREAPPPDLIWRSLVGETTFAEPQPSPIAPPVKPSPPAQPREPSEGQPPHRFKPGVLDFLVPGRMKRSRSAAKERFQRAHGAWSADMETWRTQCVALERAHEEAVAGVNRSNALAIAAWQQRRLEFERQVSERENWVAGQRASWERHEAAGVETYVDAVLSMPAYPEFVSPGWELAYQAETKLLVLNFDMPAPDALPRLKEVRYVASKDEDVESFISDAQASKMYDSALYQLALRVAFEVFVADSAHAIDSLCLNGIVTSVSPATGHDVTACLLTFQVKRDEILSVNLDAVDPKECFRKLRGISSSRLSGMAAVPPIQRMNREDSRFIDGREVLATVDQGQNLAAMPWDDFEHLIRQLFEREFSSDGAEVRVTRASRDAGVDAVIFDPDPLRGGKIVIQAKRYTNTVDVSAVRDLFGAVHNEGAIKGILVTTSTFGPDSYSFAQDKPLTLIDGGSLLHLLQKNGTQARIDLREAKRLQSEAGIR